MNLPNKLTILRMIMIPFFLVALMVPGIPGGKWIALALFCLASLTDMLDGKIARKYNLITDFGKFMIDLDRIPAWVVIVIIAREFIISGFRLVASDNGIVIAAGWWGKIKTGCQMFMVILLICDFGGSTVHIIENVLIYLALALTIISLIDYLVKNKNVLSETK